MAMLDTEGICQYYELHGDPAQTPVMLITGLGGLGASWGPQIKRFAERYYVILPDHRGAGQSTHSAGGYRTEQLARDMISLVKHLNLAPVHVVGSSTGGAIAQHMALEQPDLVRSLTLSSTFARFDEFTRREFQMRRKMAEEWERSELLAAYSLFLFSPRFTREHPGFVQGWINRAAAHPEQAGDREVALKRIDMITAHDTLDRLFAIRQPTLVTCGDHNFCTPLALSEEIARAIPGAELVVFSEGGELIEHEQEEKFFRIVSGFIDRHTPNALG